MTHSLYFDRTLIIREIIDTDHLLTSLGLKVGQDIRVGFPELISYEGIITQLWQKPQLQIVLKEVSRSISVHQSKTFNLILEGAEDHYRLCLSLRLIEEISSIGYVSNSFVEKQLSLQYQIALILSDADSGEKHSLRTEQAIPQVLHHICDTLNWQVGEFWQPHCSYQHQTHFYCTHFYAEPRILSLINTQSCSISTTKKIFFSYLGNQTEITEQQEFQDSIFAGQGGLKTVLTSPIRYNDRLLGILIFSSDQPQTINESILKMISAISHQLGSFLQRELTEYQLQLTQFTVNKAITPIFWFNYAGDIFYANEEASNLSQYNLSELQYKNIKNIDPTFTDNAWRATWQEITTRKTWSFQSFVKQKNGQLIPVENQWNYLNFQGQDYICAFIYDIRQREEQESALKLSEERYALATRSGKVGIWDWNLETQELYISPFFRQLLGYYKREELNQWQSFLELIDPVDRPEFEAGINDLLTSRKNQFTLEHRIIGQNISSHWMITQATVICDANNIPLRIVGSETDITEKKQVEIISRNYQQLLQAILDYAPAIIFAKNTDYRYILTNKKLQDIFDINPEEMIGKTDQELTKFNSLSPNILAQWETEEQDIINHRKVIEKEETFLINNRLNTYLSLKFPIYDNEGNPNGICGISTDITARVQAEKDRDRFFTMSLDLLCVAGFDGYFKRLNPEWEKVLGYSLEDLLSKTFIDFVHPEDQEYTIQEMNNLNQGKLTIDFENRYKTANGTWRWLAWKAAPYPEEGFIYAVARDITEQKIYQQALKREKQQLLAIITHAPVAMAMFDLDLNYLAYSQQWLKDFHLEGEHLLGLSLYESIPEIPPLLQEVEPQILQGNYVSKPEDCLTLSDKTKLYLRWAIQPWFTPEKQVGGTILVTQVINELVTARESALELARVKAQFLANMSHEIRTPLNGVIGIADLLSKTSLNPEQEDYVQTLNISSHNLLNLINDILDFSKLEAGQMRLESLEFDLNDCLDQVLDVVGVQAQAKGLNLYPIIDSPVPTVLLGDSNRLLQILLNLTNNAVKFTSKGEVIIRVTVEEMNDLVVTLRFEVTDTGIGLSSEQKEKLFQSFYQVDASTTRRFGGTGLGLAISQQLVTLMNGKIGVNSELGQGSTFWFTIPFTNSQYITSVGGINPSIAEIQGMKILIYDSQDYYQAFFQSCANAWGLELEWKNDIDQTIDCLQKTTAKNYDLVLVDVDTQPVPLEIIKILREKKINWVILASLKNYLFTKGLLQEAMSNYLLKPVKITRFLSCLQQIKKSDALATPTRISEAISKPSFNHLRVLLVEDTPINQKVILNQLRYLGIEADCVNHGKMALERLETHTYDIIFMDCLMPILDGYETTRLIRQREIDRHTIIVAITANALPEEEVKCREAGMDDYLSKPLQTDKLENLLHQWVIQVEPELLSDEENVLEISEEIIADDIPLVDRLHLEELTRGDREFQLELLETFIQDAPSYIQDLRSFFQAKNWDNLRRKAHQLKGSSGTVGLKSIYTDARYIEDQAEECNSSGMIERFDRIAKAITQLREIIDQW